jgi:DNA-binding FrmR family transcriptional regulator
MVSNMKHESALRRLQTVEGHIRGIQRMVEDDTYCIEVIHQIQAVQAALNKISTLILQEHMNSCLITAVRGEDASERERVLGEIVDVFEMATKT